MDMPANRLGAETTAQVCARAIVCARYSHDRNACTRPVVARQHSEFIRVRAGAGLVPHRRLRNAIVQLVHGHGRRVAHFGGRAAAAAGEGGGCAAHGRDLTQSGTGGGVFLLV